MLITLICSLAGMSSLGVVQIQVRRKKNYYLAVFRVGFNEMQTFTLTIWCPSDVILLYYCCEYNNQIFYCIMMMIILGKIIEVYFVFEQLRDSVAKKRDHWAAAVACRRHPRLQPRTAARHFCRQAARALNFIFFHSFFGRLLQICPSMAMVDDSLFQICTFSWF